MYVEDALESITDVDKAVKIIDEETILQIAQEDLTKGEWSGLEGQGYHVNESLDLTADCTTETSNSCKCSVLAYC